MSDRAHDLLRALLCPPPMMGHPPTQDDDRARIWKFYRWGYLTRREAFKAEAKLAAAEGRETP